MLSRTSPKGWAIVSKLSSFGNTSEKGAGDEIRINREGFQRQRTNSIIVAITRERISKAIISIIYSIEDSIYQQEVLEINKSYHYYIRSEAYIGNMEKIVSIRAL